MKARSCVMLALGWVAIGCGRTGAADPPLSNPELRTHASFESKPLRNKRTITVYLPPGYHSNREERYPVVYFHDGQNRMKADQTATTLIRAGKMRPVILVFIESLDRVRELTSHRCPGKKLEGGDGRLYGRFLTEELKPFIDKTYRTKPERDHTGVGGASLGGLVSIDLCRVYPDTSSMCVALSPSLQWADEQIFKDLEKDAAWVKKCRVWLHLGTKESTKPVTHAANVRRARQFAKSLEGSGLKPGPDFRYVEVQNGKHEYSYWIERIDLTLLFFFAR